MGQGSWPMRLHFGPGILKKIHELEHKYKHDNSEEKGESHGKLT